MPEIRFRLRLALAIVPLVAVVAAGCTRTAAQPAPQGPPQVSVATVIDREITEWDEFTGRLEPVESVDIRPRVSGYVVVGAVQGRRHRPQGRSAVSDR